MKIYVMDTEVLAEQNIYEQIMKVLPEARLNKIRAVKQEQGKLLSAAAGFLLLFGISGQSDLLHISDKESGPDTDFQPPVEYLIGVQGKPALIVNGKKLFYNLSHSKTKAACVIAHEECGIDLERVTPRRVKESLIRKVCTDREKELLSQMKEEERSNLFFKLWTGKESVMKWDGRGMAMGPDTIEVSDLLVQDEVEVEICGGEESNGNRKAVTVHSLAIEDYYLSVCCEKDTKIQLLVVDKAAVERFLRGLGK